jgi:hypothetical protein
VVGNATDTSERAQTGILHHALGIGATTGEPASQCVGMIEMGRDYAPESRVVIACSYPVHDCTLLQIVQFVAPQYQWPRKKLNGASKRLRTCALFAQVGIWPQWIVGAFMLKLPTLENPIESIVQGQRSPTFAAKNVSAAF